MAWNFPTVEGSWDACTPFAEYINAGGPGDCFEGFELKHRICEPIGETGIAITVASDIGKVWTHLAPWIKGFGIEFEVTPVVSDKEYEAIWPGVQAAAATD